MTPALISKCVDKAEFERRLPISGHSNFDDSLVFE
jgi:hypothetical protein